MPPRNSEASGALVPRQYDVSAILRDPKPLPEKLNGLFDLHLWAQSLLFRTPYEEPNPDYISQILLVETLSATDIEAVFRRGSVRKLQDAIPNVPGATTGPIEINDLYVSGSDFGEGAPCYMILTAADLDTGIVSKYTTGAQGLQAQVIRILSFGMWPIRCKITRMENKDKGGRFMFAMFPVD